MMQITPMSKAIKKPRKARILDHAVLPVESLEVARARFSALGFTVAPDGVHPFGTENACIYLADGTFLEPLGIAQREDCEATARKGNVFTDGAGEGSSAPASFSRVGAGTVILGAPAGDEPHKALALATFQTPGRQTVPRAELTALTGAASLAPPMDVLKRLLTLRTS